MRLLTRALALLLGAPTVSLTVANAPAGAVVQPCTVTYTAPGQAIRAEHDAGKNHSLLWATVTVEDPRTVADIDIAVDMQHPDVSVLALHLLSPQNQNLTPTIQAFNTGMASGSVEGWYTFDEESAAAPLSGASPEPKTYAPASPELPLEGFPASGSWHLWLSNYGNSPGVARSLTLTLSFTTCDTDGDGVEEKVDNCPTVANDQANHDEDTLGDACDLDMDGDGLGNTTDGCPLTATTTRTGCPTATRTATLSFTKKKHRLAIVVRSTVPGCRADAKVTLRRKKPGRDTKLLVSTTNSQGRYRIKAPRDAGRYYVTVAKSYAIGQAECSTARSKAVKVSAGAELLRTQSAAGPDTDGDGLADLSDGCPSVASPNPTGCPTVSRTARLRYLAGVDRLQARVISTATACSSRARIKLWRAQPGPDARLVVGTAYASGRLRFKVARGASYYVTVSSSYAPGIAECAKATSRTVGVPSR